jgi:T-complex protein 1 subunit gamma
MLKMILSAGGSILMTNDGNSILREIDVTHPAARTIITLSRAQDEEVGDGTTSVIVLGMIFILCCFIFLHHSRPCSW